MSRTIALLVFGVCLVPWLSCTQETFVDMREAGVPAKVDLVIGFEAREVRVYFNGQLSYSAILGTNAPLSGPIAEFQTTLSRGTNLVVVESWLQFSAETYSKRTANVTLGDSEKYFLGLILQNDGLNVNVQDTPFLYL
jgi:hypothetical protein